MKNLNLRKHIMTAISYLIPFVCAAGMLMVLGNIFGGQVVDLVGDNIGVNNLLTSLGATALGFIPVIISMWLSYSIADKAGLAPGAILGLLCKNNGYGFLGGIIVGILAGYLTRWIFQNLKVPQWMQGLLPQLIQPLIVSVVIALLMQYVIGIPIIALTNWVNNVLISMSSQPGKALLFGVVVGVLSAVDYGGPINKIVFTFAAGALSEGFGGPIANLIQASMIAPFGLTIGYLISRTTGKSLFSQQEKDALKSAFVMGCFQITEGSFPIILNDFIRITICTALGSAVSGGLIGYWGVESSVPAGGLIALPGINKPILWFVALLIGSLVFAIALQFLKRDLKTMEGLNREAVIESEEDDFSDLKFS